MGQTLSWIHSPDFANCHSIKLTLLKKWTSTDKLAAPADSSYSSVTPCLLCFSLRGEYISSPLHKKPQAASRWTLRHTQKYTRTEKGSNLILNNGWILNAESVWKDELKHWTVRVAVPVEHTVADSTMGTVKGHWPGLTHLFFDMLPACCFIKL